MELPGEMRTPVMGVVSINHGVFDAFLRRESSADGELRTDGSRLYSLGAGIAEWRGGVLAINPSVGSEADEARKDALVDHILGKIQREELLWGLVQPKSRQLHPRAGAAV
jgi:hypothetical protein